MPLSRPDFDFAPYRLSGTVVGALLNDRNALAALGDAVGRPPYKAPPQAPVLCVRPRNTLAVGGGDVALPPGADAFEIGAALALVVGRHACRVGEGQAAEHVAGWVLVVDLALPHESHYRPAVRFRAVDGSCQIGARVVPANAVVAPAAVALRIEVDGVRVPLDRVDPVRTAARLLADVSAFMTLAPGDLLVTGCAARLPRARAGQRFAVEADGFGRIDGRVVAAA